MIFFNCDKCNKEIILDTSSCRNPSPEKYHLFCNVCIKNTNVCSKSKCLKIFCLTDDDIKNLKTIYIKNKNNKTKFFIFDEIKEKAINKYGTLQNINNILKKKSKRNQKRKQKLLDSSQNRKNLLLQKLKENKLQYKNYGDCYSYVHYNTPSLDTVIKNEIVKLQKKNKRRIKLAKELSKINLTLDESLKSCYNYINKIGSYKNIKETVRAVEIEYFLKYNTEFDEMKNYLGSEEAKEKAIQSYYNNKLKNSNTIKINFD